MIEESRALNAMLYVLSKLKETQRDMLKVFKILWFADLSHMKKYGRFITEDNWAKMPLGPVPSRLYDIVKGIRGNDKFYEKYAELMSVTNHQVVNPLAPADMDYLSDSDIEELDKSIRKNKDLASRSLSEKSHGKAWENSSMGYDISLDNILDELGMKGNSRSLILEADAFKRALA